MFLWFFPHGALRKAFLRAAEAGREGVSAIAQWWGAWRGWVLRSRAMVGSVSGVSIPKLRNGASRVGPYPSEESEGASLSLGWYFQNRAMGHLLSVSALF